MSHSLLMGFKSPYRTNRAFKYFRNLSSSLSWIPTKDSDGILGTERIVRQHRHKCSRTEIKQPIFDKSHISWERFGNICLEMTKSRFHPKKKHSEELSGIPWGTPNILSNSGTLCQHPTMAGVPFQSSLHKSAGALSRLESPIDLEGIFFIQVALIEGVSNSDSGWSSL